MKYIHREVSYLIEPFERTVVLILFYFEHKQGRLLSGFTQVIFAWGWEAYYPSMKNYNVSMSRTILSIPFEYCDTLPHYAILLLISVPMHMLSYVFPVAYVLPKFFYLLTLYLTMTVSLSITPLSVQISHMFNQFDLICDCGISPVAVI